MTRFQPGVEIVCEPICPAERQRNGDYGLMLITMKNEQLRGEIADPFLKMLI